MRKACAYSTDLDSIQLLRMPRQTQWMGQLMVSCIAQLISHINDSIWLFATESLNVLNERDDFYCVTYVS